MHPLVLTRDNTETSILLNNNPMQPQSNPNENDLILPNDNFSEIASLSHNQNIHDTSQILYRVQDILFSIKIIAFLSKYPQIRTNLHSLDIFSLVQVFTVPSNLLDVRHWAIICMRNAFKRDKRDVLLRRCGNLKCTNVESFLKQYSKCSRCRRVTYCSKLCLKGAWTFHRYH